RRRTVSQSIRIENIALFANGEVEPLGHGAARSQWKIAFHGPGEPAVFIRNGFFENGIFAERSRETSALKHNLDAGDSIARGIDHLRLRLLGLDDRYNTNAQQQ